MTARNISDREIAYGMGSDSDVRFFYISIVRSSVRFQCTLCLFSFFLLMKYCMNMSGIQLERTNGWQFAY